MRWLPLGILYLVSLAGCGTARVEGFTASSPTAFLYSAHTNTVMPANQDGVAERIRREWLADAVQAHGMCADGYVVDSRRLVPEVNGRFGNGGDILYAGRCLREAPIPAPPPAVSVRGERG